MPTSMTWLKKTTAASRVARLPAAPARARSGVEGPCESRLALPTELWGGGAGRHGAPAARACARSGSTMWPFWRMRSSNVRRSRPRSAAARSPSRLSRYSRLYTRSRRPGRVAAYTCARLRSRVGALSPGRATLAGNLTALESQRVSLAGGRCRPGLPAQASPPRAK